MQLILVVSNFEGDVTDNIYPPLSLPPPPNRQAHKQRQLITVSLLVGHDRQRFCVDSSIAPKGDGLDKGFGLIRF